MEYLIGIDVGTTGIKTVIFNPEGKAISSAFELCSLNTPYPNWAEQNPEEWWESTKLSLKRALSTSQIKPSQIKGIGLSGQMHGAVLLDKGCQVLRPCILWCDQRTSSQCKWIIDKLGEKRLASITGNTALPGFTAPKVVWVRDNEPEIYEKIDKVLLPKDYIRFRLTNVIATEVSDAAGSLLFDINKREWSKEILEKMKIPKDWMPKCFESIDVCGRISKKVAKETGLKEGIAVVGGGADNTCSAVGTGIVKEGKLSSSIGTSGVVLAYTPKVKRDPLFRTHTFCHSVPHRWYVMGVMQSAGLSLRWFRDTLGMLETKLGELSGIDPYFFFSKEAERVRPGSEGLIFLPYLMGERTPHLNPNAKGTLFGLTMRHRREDIIRAIMEGVVYGLKDSLQIIKSINIDVDEIRVTGGGARSKLWCQIQADVFGQEVVTLGSEEGPALGAAILAAVGVNLYTTVEEAVEKMVKIGPSLEPIAENVRRYEEYHQLFQSLYRDLKEDFDKVSEV